MGLCAQYTAVPQQEGAPLRTVTVRDAIGDLPPITNGADLEEMPYSGAPHSSGASRDGPPAAALSAEHRMLYMHCVCLRVLRLHCKPE